MRVIPLTKGFVAVISAIDFRRVNRYSWHVTHSKGSRKKYGKPYAATKINGKKVYLHRFLTDCPEHLQADHKNHQTLDCRRENLECVPHSVNLERRRKRNERYY